MPEVVAAVSLRINSGVAQELPSAEIDICGDWLTSSTTFSNACLSHAVADGLASDKALGDHSVIRFPASLATCGLAQSNSLERRLGL